MSSIKLTADSGGGTFEIKAPSSSGNTRVLTLPDTGNATVLTTDTSVGKVLQVVSVSDSVRESTGSVSLSTASTYYDTPFAVTITPSSSSNKILLMGHVMGESSQNDLFLTWRIKRAISGGATTNIQAPAAGNRIQGISVAPSGFYSADVNSTPTVFNWSGLLDSPSTTSAITYTFQITVNQFNSHTFYYNRTVGNTDSADYERGLSWITAQEVAA